MDQHFRTRAEYRAQDAESCKKQLERAVGQKRVLRGNSLGISTKLENQTRKSRDKHIDTVLTLPECSSILPASGSPTVPLESEGHVCEFVAGPGVLLSWALDSKFKAFFWELSMTNSRGYSGGFGLLPSALPKMPCGILILKPHCRTRMRVRMFAPRVASANWAVISSLWDLLFLMAYHWFLNVYHCLSVFFQVFNRKTWGFQRQNMHYPRHPAAPRAIANRPPAIFHDSAARRPSRWAGTVGRRE